MSRGLVAIAFVVAAGCKDTPSTPPDPAKYRAMSPAEKCSAVAPRAIACMDELLIADINDVMTGSAGQDTAKQLESEVREQRSSAKEATDMHRIRCEGSPGYPNAVIACWNTQPCKAYAACVIRTEHATPPAKRVDTDTVPMDLDRPNPPSAPRASRVRVRALSYAHTTRCAASYQLAIRSA